MLLHVETQTEIVLKILRVYNVTTIPSRQDILSENNPLYFSKSFKSRTYESAWRRTRLTILKSKRGFRVLACEERFGLSGLTDHGALSSPLHRTAPPSPRATTFRYCALWRCFRSAVPTVPSAQFSSVRSRYYSVRSCRVQEKKPCQTTFQLPCRPTTMPASPIALTIFLEPPVS